MRRWLLPAVTTLMCACSALQPPPAEPVTTHVLSARPAIAAATQRRDVAVEVMTPRAWPGFDTPEIVYHAGSYHLERYALNRWVDTPARMLAPLVVRALEDSSVFRAVVQPPATAHADYRLDTEVVRIAQDFAARPSSVQVVIRAQITDLRARRVVATRVFEEVETATAESAAGGVEAANVALGRVLARIVRFCIDETADR